MLITAVCLGISGCSDPCDSMNCGSNGTCTDGDCLCDAGFDGLNCETELRAKFLGGYNATETCQSGTYTYEMSISANPGSPDQVNIFILGDVVLTLMAVVDRFGLSIPYQSVGTGTISGTGNIAGNVLTITTNTTSGGYSQSCYVSALKQ
jgi:hypothetical protein